jgi:hypothetical protein
MHLCLVGLPTCHLCDFKLLAMAFEDNVDTMGVEDLLEDGTTSERARAGYIESQVVPTLH